MGACFPKDKGGLIFKPLGPMGKSQRSKGKPIKTVHCPFLVFFPNHLYLPKVVEVVITWEWEEYGKKFELGRAPIFEKHILTHGESKNPKTYAHSTRHLHFSFFTTILSFT